MITIENWSVTTTPDPYLAPEMRTSHLQGNVYGHPDFEEGSHIITSSIIAAKQGQITTRSGTCYTLGSIDPTYEEQFPNAEARLFASLGPI